MLSQTSSAMVVDEVELTPDRHSMREANVQQTALCHSDLQAQQQQELMRWQTIWGIVSFPQELINTTIDYLQYDKAALQKCCLVHRSWLDTARFHLFRSLRVSNAPHNPISKKSKETAMPKNFQAFLAFISYEASDGFCQSVRTLFMIGDEKDQDRDTRTPVDTQMLASILMKLPNLRVLDLGRVRFQERGFLTSHIPTTRFRLDMLSLNFVGSREDPLSSLCSILGIFAELGLLRASYVDSLREGNEVMALRNASIVGLSAHLRIHRASLKGWPGTSNFPTVSCFLDVMRKSETVRSLQWLELKCNIMREVDALGAFLKEAGNIVMHIALDVSELFRSQQDPDKIIDALKILECHNLLSLRICIFPNLLNPVGNEVALVDRASDCLAKLLSAITPTVRRVTVVLGYNDMPLEACKLIGWEMLRDVNWDRLQDLEQVTIGLMPRHSDRLTEINARDHIRNRLSTLQNRGLLHFEAMTFWDESIAPSLLRKASARR